MSDTTPSSTTSVTFNHHNRNNFTTINTSNGGYRHIKKDTIKAKEYTGTMRKYSVFLTEKYTLHPLLMSEFALDIYTVLVLSMLIRRYWILHGITLVILGHIADILFSWFVHVKEAREIRLFKSWLLWWIRVGLDFANNTAEGDVLHRVLVANTVHFWNLIGKNFTINWFDKIASNGRTNVLNRAKEQLNELTMNHNNFVASLRDSLPKRNPG